LATVQKSGSHFGNSGKVDELMNKLNKDIKLTEKNVAYKVDVDKCVTCNQDMPFWKRPKINIGKYNFKSYECSDCYFSRHAQQKAIFNGNIMQVETTAKIEKAEVDAKKFGKKAKEKAEEIELKTQIFCSMCYLECLPNGKCPACL